MSESLGAITLHDGQTFSISTETGDIIVGAGRGLYHEDTRFLRVFQLLLDDQSPILLTARTPQPNESRHFLTNPQLDQAQRGTLTLVRRRLVGDGMHEDIDIQNFGDDTATFTLSLKIETDFADIFAVKRAVETGVIPPKPGELITSGSGDKRSALLRLKRGIEIYETVLDFSESFELMADEIRFRVSIPKRGLWHLCTVVNLKSGGRSVQPPYSCTHPVDEIRDHARVKRQEELNVVAPKLQTDHRILEKAYLRATEDLASLRIRGEETCKDYCIAAGIPWFMALFGRDSLIASFQSLLHDPSLARGTLLTLAHLQGTKSDKTSGEEPGKILHEYRPGMAFSPQKIIPRFPYYGTVDATPLFLITLSEYVRCTGDLSLAKQLWKNIEQALLWLERSADCDGDGLIKYFLESDIGLSNQGWKDSGDSIRFRDGSVAKAPIALVEVQGYACDAYTRTAELFDFLGKGSEANALRKKARHLKQIILSRFWLEERQFFALALDGEMRPVDALTSNPGHLLWSGVLPREYAKKVATLLLSDDMFSGYGIRTMAESETAYNPISYHNGSVWPHDTSLILSGLSRYGFTEETIKVAQGLLKALEQYSSERLPELFAGFSFAQYGTPVEYPTANSPQAWATGAVILLTRALIGLEVNAPARQVSLNPIAIPGMSYLSLKGIPLGGDHVDVVITIKDGNAIGEFLNLPAGWKQAA